MKGEETTLCYGNRNLRPWQYCPEEKQFVSGTAHLGLARLKQAVLDAELAVPSAWFESLLPNKKGLMQPTTQKPAFTLVPKHPWEWLGLEESVPQPGGLQLPWTSVMGEIRDADMENVALLGPNLPIQQVECVETVVKVWHNRSHEGVSA